MGRPAKYDWEEITNMVRAGMPRPEVERKYGCSSGRLSEELKKRGIKEPEPELLRAKDALVDAVRKVSEVSESFGAKSSVIAVAAHETGHKLVLESFLDEANAMAVDIMRERRESGEATIMDAKQVIDMTSRHLETRYGKVTPDTVFQLNQQINNEAQTPARIKIVAPKAIPNYDD